MSELFHIFETYEQVRDVVVTVKDIINDVLIMSREVESNSDVFRYSKGYS